MVSNAPVNASKIVPSVISQIVGARPPLLPGESAEHYQEALRALIEELGARTHMQVYLAQRMFDCMWEIRNYEVASRGIIFNEMLTVLVGSRHNANESQLPLVRAVHEGDWGNPILLRAMEGKGHTKESLYALAVDRAGARLRHLHQLSSIRTKSQMQFHAAYEALVNRPLVQERLRMQAEQMRRGLSAIDISAEPINGNGA